MTATDEPVADLWRFPELATRLRWSPQIDQAERGRLLARGLADRSTPRQAVESLITAGEFDVAERILDSIAGLVGAAAAKGLARQIEEARRLSVARIATEARVLHDRSLRIGNSDVDLRAITQAARGRRDDGQAHLVALAADLGVAEDRALRTTKSELEARLGDAPTTAERIWADQIEALLAVKEIAAARHVLAEGPGAVALLPVEEPVADWVWPTTPLSEILRWFGDSALLAPPGLRDYVVDDDARALLDALADVDSAASVAAAALVASLQKLVGTDLPPAAEPMSPDARRATLTITDDLRLPAMRFVGRGHRLPLVLSASRPPEVSDGADPLVWLVPRMQAPSDGAGPDTGTAPPAIITVSDLLGLLRTARPPFGLPRTARSTASRRMGLLRIVCRQLPVSAVVPADAFGATGPSELRHQVWWLMHVFGVSPDGVAVDTVLFESGAHPRLLVLTLHHAIGYVREHGALRLEPDAFAHLRISLRYREAIEAELHHELDDAQVAALFTMIFYASADDLRTALESMAADADVRTAVTELLDIDEVIQSLCTAGYLVTASDGQVALCECGITHVLRLGDPHEIAKQALVRLAARPRVSDDPAEQRRNYESQLQQEQLRRRLAEIRAHDEYGRAEDARDAVDLLAGSTAARIRGERLRRDQGRTMEAHLTERVDLNVVQICQQVARDLERYAPGIDILVAGDVRATVVGSKLALEIALRNIIRNATQAVAETQPTGAGTVAITVSVDPGPLGEVVIDIEDNGPGLPSALLESYRPGEAPASTRHAGAGEGIEGARALLLMLGGTPELMSWPSILWGGAQVRLRLPRTDPS